MAGASKEGFSGIVNLTPHKIALCHLIQYFAPAAHSSLPIPFKSVSQHNRLGLFLFSLTRACNDFVEPSLDELITQFKAVGVGGFEYDWFVDWLIEDLTSRLSALSSPDDLYNFFEKLRGILSPAEVTNMEDEQCFLDPSSHLGVFIRCCILAFSILTFEGVCHLLSNMAAYCNSTDPMYGLPEEDAFNTDPVLQESHEYHELNRASDKYIHDFEAGSSAGESSSFHIQAGRPLYGVPDKLFLRSKWQIQGYLNEQADLLERHAGSFRFNTFEATLKHLQKMAPDMHHVKYLRYLNNLYNDDYLSALDNLHCYFDYSAGMEGIFTGSSAPPVSGIQVGRYESALLCLGIMHTRFGHSKQALEALTEAVRISQQNNDDSCLTYTLAAMCDLLSKIGICSTSGIIGSQYSLGLGTPLSTQQQLLVLLKRSLKRAESLKLTCLVAFNRLALAGFYLKHVNRPLLSFGPKASIKLRTNPTHVCKELRLSSYLLSEFGSDGLSLPNDGGTFSTAWLKNLEKLINSPTSFNGKRTNDYDTFHFTSQPNPIPGSVLQLAGASYLLRATSWELYGSAPLVRSNALIYATCFADSASSSELSLAYCKLIQHLAVFKGYKEAFIALKLAEEKFSSVSKSHIHLLKFQLLHERALHRGQLKLAQQVCDELGILASSITGVDLELKTEASIRLARTLLAANQFSQAAAVACSLFCECYKFNLHVENATILLLLAEIHKKSGNAVLGLSYALASLSFCRTFNLDLLEASTTLTIAELWLSLGRSHAKRASNLVHQTLPMILGHGGLELRARANIAFVKCHLCDPSFSVSDDAEMVLDPLRQAAEDLETLEFHEMAAEAFYLAAVVYDALGRAEEREAAAASFKNHIVALENPGSGSEDEQRNL
ncbi:unnamed protein product [Spirodela intermedia]|uniref:Anaphase-promoting complex subunit 5 n=1 Tax=Spirodela intermedia TaxID=51605 RepID=A0A7I8LG27_SPIIN|nr:unnamed protein product [Spirodela intermedia]